VSRRRSGRPARGSRRSRAMRGKQSCLEHALQGLSAQIVISLVSIMEPDSWLGVELRHFAALQAVASAGSFGGAAKQLGYTQSAISQQPTSPSRQLNCSAIRTCSSSRTPRPSRR
jgi:hypothetical protein